MKHTPVKNRQQRAERREDGFLESIPELRDDRRMQYLFSNFPQRESNPKKWEDLRAFWTKVVYDVCRHNHVFAVTLHDLKEWLSLKGMVPFGLETLLGTLESDKKVQHITEFTVGSPSFSGWVLKTLASSLYWGYGKLVSSGSSKAKEGKYVFIDIIKDYAEELMSYVKDADRSSTSERVMLLSHLAALVPSEWNLSTEDLKLILVYLEKIKQLAIIQLNDGTMGVKLDSQVAQVTEVDRGVLQMQVVLDQLEEQVGKLTEDVEKCVKQASEQLQAKNRPRAMAHLKKKKLLQDVLTKRMDNVHKIQQILLSIDSATTNNQVVEAFAVGVASLKHANAQHSADEVHAIMDELGDLLADQAELDKAIGANVADPNLEFDESELSRELEALVEEDAEEKRVERERQEAERKEKEKEKEREREKEKEREKANEVAYDEAELERDLEKLANEEESAKQDSSVDVLADLVGGVKLEGDKKEKNKQMESPMLA